MSEDTPRWKQKSQARKVRRARLGLAVEQILINALGTLLGGGMLAFAAVALGYIKRTSTTDLLGITTTSLSLGALGYTLFTMRGMYIDNKEWAEYERLRNLRRGRQGPASSDLAEVNELHADLVDLVEALKEQTKKAAEAADPANPADPGGEKPAGGQRQ